MSLNSRFAVWSIVTLAFVTGAACGGLPAPNLTLQQFAPEWCSTNCQSYFFVGGHGAQAFPSPSEASIATRQVRPHTRVYGKVVDSKWVEIEVRPNRHEYLLLSEMFPLGALGQVSSCWPLEMVTFKDGEVPEYVRFSNDGQFVLTLANPKAEKGETGQAFYRDGVFALLFAGGDERLYVSGYLDLSARSVDWANIPSSESAVEQADYAPSVKWAPLTGGCKDSGVVTAR